MSIAVLVDHADGVVRGTTLELLTLARGLAPEVHAVWIGGEPQDEVVAAHGASTLHHVVVDGADEQLTTSVVDGLQTVLVGLPDVDLLLVTSSFEGREVAARLAVRTGAGVVTGASSLAHEDGHWVARKVVLAGSWATACAATGPLAIVAVAPHAVQAAPLAAPAAAETVNHTVAASAAARAVTVVSREQRPHSDRPSLVEAEVVVVGGRGVEGDFSGVEALADVLGAAVGATRVATDEGWIGHEAQVGQTGVTISPRLYLGVGVSGAVHHRGGMDAADTIVAINNDPDAPIFEFADYGIVGDLGEVLPELTKALAARRS